MKRRKLIAIALGVSSVFVFILRETEIISFNSYKSSLTGKQDSKWNSELSHFVAGIPSASAKTSLNVSSKTTDRLARILSDLLRAQQINGTVRVDFEKWSLNGPYWMPLRKTGQLDYSVSVDADLQQGNKGAKVLGTVSGTVEITVSGPCSLAEFKAILLRDIASKIAEQLKSDLNQPIPHRATNLPTP